MIILRQSLFSKDEDKKLTKEQKIALASGLGAAGAGAGLGVLGGGRIADRISAKKINNKMNDILDAFSGKELDKGKIGDVCNLEKIAKRNRNGKLIGGALGAGLGAGAAYGGYKLYKKRKNKKD